MEGRRVHKSKPLVLKTLKNGAEEHLQAVPKEGLLQQNLWQERQK